MKHIRCIAGLVIIALLVWLYRFLAETGTLDIIMDSDALKGHLARHGVLGPLIIILAMATAIVMSPIPSAPIALASGAAYGHIWGTVYVLVGAEMGALTAFMVARLVGHDLMQRWLGGRLPRGLVGSQDSLTAIVFIARLLPFVSFDIVSYAAGLTALSTWRFAIATLAGMAPASFLLAHLGGEMSTGDARKVVLSLALLGMLALLPVALKLARRRGHKRPSSGGKTDGGE